MARVALIREPGEAPAPDLADLFTVLFPGNPAPEFNDDHSLMAVLAHSPKLALPAARLSAAVILSSAWGQRAGLRELAFQTLGHHFGDNFSTAARRRDAEAAGLTADQLAAIPDWRNSALFDDEQQLVMEYTQAVVTGRVPAELFARIVARYGEREAIECTAAIGLWSFWAMVAGAVGL